MKTKEKILSMTKEELSLYKFSSDLSNNVNINSKSSKENNNCFRCFDCFECEDCYDCFDCHKSKNCAFCKGLRDGEMHEYKIANVQFTKEEYEQKMEEIL